MGPVGDFLDIGQWMFMREHPPKMNDVIPCSKVFSNCDKINKDSFRMVCPPLLITYSRATPGMCFSSMFSLHLSKTRSFPMKTRVVWVPGSFII